MTDATTEPGKARKTDPETRLTTDFAQSLWQASLGANLPKDAETRKAAWKEAKKGWMQTARAAQKRMVRRGIVLTRTEGAAADADAEEADA